MVNFFNSNKRLLVIIILLFSFIVGLVYFNWQKQTSLSYHPRTSRVQKALSDQKTRVYFRDLIPAGKLGDDKIKLAPSFDIKSYITNSQIPQIPKDLPIYQFKTNLNQQEIAAITANFLTDQYQTEILSSKSDYKLYNDNGTVIFNSQTGQYSYQGSGIIVPFKVTIDNNQLLNQARDYFINKMQLFDETVRPTAYYTKNNNNFLVYIEFHRDLSTNAQYGNLPILNPVGVINAAENENLSQFSLTQFSDYDVNDDSITFASDVKQKARRIDYNAAIAVISQQGELISFENRIRPIFKVTTLAQKQLSLISPDQALLELKQKGSYFAVAKPAGQGVIDFDKAFPDNKLNSKIGYITDFTLAFIEKPINITQIYLQPAYIIRGYTENETGVRLAFAETIPAIENKNSQSSRLSSFILSLSNLISKQVLAQIINQREYQCLNGPLPVSCTFETFKNTPTPAQPTNTIPTVTPFTVTQTYPTPTTLLLLSQIQPHWYRPSRLIKKKNVITLIKTEKLSKPRSD